MAAILAAAPESDVLVGFGEEMLSEPGTAEQALLGRVDRAEASMTTLQTSVHIPHPPEVVWSVLTAGADWKHWNPTQPGLRGTIEEGASGRIALRLARWTLWAPITFQRVSPGRALFWQGGVRHLLYAVHGFELRSDDAGTQVMHIEHFTGVIPALLGALLGRMLAPMYQATNDGLLARAAVVAAQR